jgi:hypothetical protein
MKRNQRLLFIFALLLTTGLATTSCDAPSKDVQIEVIEDVVSYPQYPYADVTQGYYIKPNSEEAFQTLFPNTKSPFVLYVKLTSEDGLKALKATLKFTNPYVTDIHEIGDGGYFVTTNKYFESSLFYVSNSYQAYENVEPMRSPTFILPQISVKMKNGKDISTVVEQYKTYLTLDKDKEISGISVLDCNLNNAYDVLKLAAIIHQLDDVEWVAPDMTGGFSTY